jgi:hypothetical protein
MGEVVVATVTARGKARALERLRISDDSYRRPGRITSVRIEVHYPRGLKVDVRLDPKAHEQLRQYGITQIEVVQADDGGEIFNDELHIWPPRDRAPEDRFRTDEEQQQLEDEDRDLERRLAPLRRAYRHLSSRARIGKQLHEDLLANKADQPIVSFFADLLGGVDLPPRSVWDRTDRALQNAELALDRGDPGAAARALLQALGAEIQAQKALGTYRAGTISGGESAVSKLEKAKAVGGFAGALVPGAGGKILGGAAVLAEAVSEAIFQSDPVPAPILAVPERGLPGLPGSRGRRRSGGGDLVPGKSPLGEYGIDKYSTFRNRKRDRLDGHEMLQNAWLKAKGISAKRGSSEFSKNNPAVALRRRMHKRVNREQRKLGLYNEAKLAKMTAEENIALNSEAMKRAGVPDFVIETLKKQALEHARQLPQLVPPGPR